MQQQLQETQLQCLGFFLGRRWLRDTINRHERGEGNWLITFQCMNQGHQQWYWVSDLKGGTLSPVECFAKAWHRQKSWCESLSETASISEIPRHKTPAGSENTLSCKQPDSSRESGHHMHFLYLFPSVVISELEMLFKQTHVFHTHGHFYGIFHIPCIFQLLLSAAAGCFQQQESGLHEIPSLALEDLFWAEKGQFVCLRPRGKALHPCKQTKWVFILAKEGARRYLLYDLKAMYLGHLLTDKETHLIWGQLSRAAYTAGLKESLCGLQQHSCDVPGVVWSIWCGVSHDAFVLEVSFPSQDQASCN